MSNNQTKFEIRPILASNKNHSGQPGEWSKCSVCQKKVWQGEPVAARDGDEEGVIEVSTRDENDAPFRDVKLVPVCNICAFHLYKTVDFMIGIKMKQQNMKREDAEHLLWDFIGVHENDGSV